MNIKPASCLLAGFFWFLFSVLHPGISTADTGQHPQKAKILESHGKLPLYFTENRGQLDPKVRFNTKTSGQALYFTDEGIVFDLLRGETTALDEEKPPPPPGGEPQPEPFDCPTISNGRLENVTFPSDADCQEYIYQGTLTIGNGVTMEDGAKVTIKATKINIESSFRAKNGAVVKIITQP